MNSDFLKNFFCYDPESGVFTRRKKWGRQNVGDPVGSISPQGYVQVGVGGRTYGAHRLAWLYVTGSFPDGEIDHINRNRSDNRFKNLRAVTRSENLMNTIAKQTSKSGVKGVSLRSLRKGKRPKKMWRADFSFNKKRFYLGNFYTLEAASEAIEKKRLELMP